MKRWFAHPLLTGLLLLAWLLLQQSVAPRSIIFGTLLALLLCRILDRLQPQPVRLRHPGTLLRLAGRVCMDIVRSNIAVARLVLRRRPAPTSGFVSIPLTLTNPYGLATLACIITATPGTLWVSHDSQRRVLVIHVLELGDAANWAATIQQRYEQPLREIFE